MLKTNKSMMKRVKVTKNGKVLFNKAGKSHLLRNKRKAAKKQKNESVLSNREVKKIKDLLPYNF